MKTIAFFIPFYYFGGVERVTDTVTAELVRRNACKVVLISPHYDQMSRMRAEAVGYDFVPLEIAPDQRITSRQTSLNVAKILRQKNIDVLVMAVNALGYLDEMRETVGRSLTLMYHIHGMPLWEVTAKIDFGRMMARKKSRWAYWKWSLLKGSKERFFQVYTKRYVKMYRRVYDSVDRMLVLCDSYCEELSKILNIPVESEEFKVRSAYNPMDLTEFKFAAATVKRKEVVYVGRLSYDDKRVDRLIRIWGRVEKQYPDWRLKIVGDGNEYSSLKSMALDMGLEHIEFCGYSENPEVHYATASILCLTSSHEGWGMVLAEAMASGVVPMAFDCSLGVRELLGSGRGVLVRPFDEEEYARQLSALMESEDDRARYRALYPEYVERFSVSEVAKNWMRILRQDSR